MGDFIADCEERNPDQRKKKRSRWSFVLTQCHFFFLLQDTDKELSTTILTQEKIERRQQRRLHHQILLTLSNVGTSIILGHYLIIFIDNRVMIAVSQQIFPLIVS